MAVSNMSDRSDVREAYYLLVCFDGAVNTAEFFLSLKKKNTKIAQPVIVVKIPYKALSYPY